MARGKAIFGGCSRSTHFSAAGSNYVCAVAYGFDDTRRATASWSSSRLAAFGRY